MRFFRSVLLPILLIAGFMMAMGINSSDENGLVESIMFFIAYLALVLTLMREYHLASEGTKIRRTKIVADHNPVLLQMKLNDELYNLKKETIINVQMVDSKTVIIVYTE